MTPNSKLQGAQRALCMWGGDTPHAVPVVVQAPPSPPAGLGRCRALCQRPFIYLVRPGPHSLGRLLARVVTSFSCRPVSTRTRTRMAPPSLREAQRPPVCAPAQQPEIKRLFQLG